MNDQIRVAVYDMDTLYCERFCSYMGEKFRDTYAFFPVGQKQQLNEIVNMRAAEVILVPIELKEEFPAFIYDIRVGYLTETRTDKAGEIYRYQDLRGIETDLARLLAIVDTTVRVVVFAGAGNFVGTSALAAAFAKRMAAKEQKVLYLNVDNEGDPHMIYHMENPRDLGTVIGSISTNGTGTREFAGALNRDIDGVYYVNNAKAPLDMMYLNEKQMGMFLEGMKERGEYRVIVVESRLEINPALFAAMNIADRVVLVSDGSNASIRCLDKAWGLICRLEENGKRGLKEKCSIMYNRFQKQFGRRYKNTAVPVKGTLYMLPPKRPEEIAEQLSYDMQLGDILR